MNTQHLSDPLLKNALFSKQTSPWASWYTLNVYKSEFIGATTFPLESTFKHVLVELVMEEISSRVILSA